MNHPPLNRTNMVRAAALIAPVLIIQSAHRLITPPEPLAATAAEDSNAALAKIYTAPKATADQTAAIDRAALLSPFELEQTPFYYAPLAEPSIAIDTNLPPNFDTSMVRVSSISGSGDATFAVINGTVCQAGDEIAEGVIVDNIDPLERTVTLTAEGKPIALTLVDPLDN